jgi:hypothetical protein
LVMPTTSASRPKWCSNSVCEGTTEIKRMLQY